MLAIHCCALQGRFDAIKLLLRYDPEQLIRKELDMENQVNRRTFLFIMVPKRVPLFEWR